MEWPIVRILLHESGQKISTHGAIHDTMQEVKNNETANFSM